MTAKQTDFARRLIAWFRVHGRHDLPWHGCRDPYRIWVSEIMLQQTQVATVIPYYERFMARFPNVQALATSSIDDVLHLWTGLGYYARARNLHGAARVIINEYGGAFPGDVDTLQRLPGIGKSTAGAILAFAFGQRHAILDGNVKRILARYYRISGSPTVLAVERELWELAAANTPNTCVSDYTQAIMDLGAMVCRRKRPACPSCPLAVGCKAHQYGDPESYPTPKPRKARPTRQTTMVMIRNEDGHVLLQRRPPSGVWGGLWSFPEGSQADLRHWCAQKLGVKVKLEPAWRTIAHTFTHFELEITPIPARLDDTVNKVMEQNGLLWYNPTHPEILGLPTPVKRLLDALENPL